MAKSTVTQVYELARSLLSDDRIAGGHVYTNAKLQAHYANAYERMARAMATVSNPFSVAWGHYNLPANTGVLDPATAGLSSFGEPIELWERAPGDSVAISGIALDGNGLATVTTGSAHGWSTGYTIIQFGVLGIPGANEEWTITVTGASTYELNGSRLTGSYTSGGTAAHSSEDFVEMAGPVRVQQTSRTTPSGPPLREWDWRGDVLRFAPINEARQLRIVHSVSGSAPTDEDATIQVDDARSFLAHATAGAASRFRNPTMSQELLAVAYGVDAFREERIGGLLYGLLNQAVLTQQTYPQKRSAFDALEEGPEMHNGLIYR